MTSIIASRTHVALRHMDGELMVVPAVIHRRLLSATSASLGSFCHCGQPSAVGSSLQDARTLKHKPCLLQVHRSMDGLCPDPHSVHRCGTTPQRVGTGILRSHPLLQPAAHFQHSRCMDADSVRRVQTSTADSSKRSSLCCACGSLQHGSSTCVATPVHSQLWRRSSSDDVGCSHGRCVCSRGYSGHRRAAGHRANFSQPDACNAADSSSAPAACSDRCARFLNTDSSMCTSIVQSCHCNRE